MGERATYVPRETSNLYGFQVLLPADRLGALYFHAKGEFSEPVDKLTSRLESAAGVIPGTRRACPKLGGRTRSKRSTISCDKLGTLRYAKSDGINNESC